MEYFSGATQDERWKNDLLNEIRKQNQLLTEILGRNAQVSNDDQVKGQRGRAKGVSA